MLWGGQRATTDGVSTRICWSRPLSSKSCVATRIDTCSITFFPAHPLDRAPSQPVFFHWSNHEAAHCSSTVRHRATELDRWIPPGADAQAWLVHSCAGAFAPCALTCRHCLGGGHTVGHKRHGESPNAATEAGAVASVAAPTDRGAPPHMMAPRLSSLGGCEPWLEQVRAAWAEGLAICLILHFFALFDFAGGTTFSQPSEATGPESATPNDGALARARQRESSSTA